MSIKAMTEVWENSKTKGNELLLMLALADYANEDGVCFPGMATLAKKTRQSSRTVIRMVDKLTNGGEVATLRRRVKGNKYAVLAGCEFDERLRRIMILHGMVNPDKSDKLSLSKSDNLAYISAITVSVISDTQESLDPLTNPPLIPTDIISKWNTLFADVLMQLDKPTADDFRHLLPVGWDGEILTVQALSEQHAARFNSKLVKIFNRTAPSLLGASLTIIARGS